MGEFEDRLRDHLGDMMLRAMNNKAEILAQLLSDMETLPRMGAGLSNFEAFAEEVMTLADDGLTDEAFQKMTPRAMAQMIRTLAKTCRIQSRIILHLCCFALIYGNGKSYDGDATDAAIKFGRGKEALQAMFNTKFGGNPFKRGK